MALEYSYLGHTNIFFMISVNCDCFESIPPSSYLSQTTNKTLKEIGLKIG